MRSIPSFLMQSFLIITLIAALLGSNCSVAQQAEAGAAKSGSDAADNPGQSDLDSAVVKRIDAKTPDQLEAVGTLLESAIKKGLDEENASFAKKMLGSVLLQRSQQIAGAMVRARGRQQLQMRDEALRGLEQAVKNDPGLVEAWFLIARLNLLPNGDRDAITEATTKAIELLEDEPVQQSAAYVLRALTQEDDEAQMADLDAAAEKDPKNLEAFQARAALRMKNEDVEGAVKDLEHILSVDPGNTAVAQAAVQQLVDLDRVADALELMTKTIEAKPSAGLYRIRAFLYKWEAKEKEALDDLNKALALQPRDAASLLQRAEISLFQKDVKAAKRDLKSASDLDVRIANSDQAVFVRCLIAVEEGRMADAINDMKLLVSRDPGNIARQLQLASLFQQDERPRKAIDVYSAILDRDSNNARVLRSRGDALLSVGDHSGAIEDYERALKAVDGQTDSEDNVDLPGILNNLAWVLSTSPNDSIRDGKRAVELGEKAAKLTEYKEPHILSTLAAGYAENGDFEKAIKWSSKAVELGREKDHEQLKQLEEELDSYRKGEAWREKQDTKENEVPILSPEDLIDT
ncbi:MAG: tetratricopeptide repeat protein [Pirellulales bacterium]|nr:tetratricopeptide repeat protein [Pirellulales bacterium]